jgi:hypothetical protein
MVIDLSVPFGTHEIVELLFIPALLLFFLHPVGTAPKEQSPDAETYGI